MNKFNLTAFKTFLKSHFLYLLAFTIIFSVVQNQVFKKEIDINGDNASYYIGAKAIHQGDGYANLMLRAKPKTNAFPPGYPFLMSLVMKVSDSFVAQKVFNCILLGIACFLLYLIVFQFSNNKLLALTASLLPTFNYLILHFSTMMMSESAFIAFSMLAFYALFKLKEGNDFKTILKDPYFYTLIISSAYAYHIRTQGISLIVAFVVFFLIKKDWKRSMAYMGGFTLCLLPWMIRNKINNISSNSYTDKMLKANLWRPEEGSLEFSDVIQRALSTVEMLITKAIPDSILPNYTVDYASAVTPLSWILGIALIAFIVFGFWKYFKLNMWLFIAYIIFSCGIISLWAAPSGNRYLVSVVPLLQIGLLLGILSLFQAVSFSFSKKGIKPNILLVAFIFISSFSYSKDIKKLKEENNRPLPPAYKNYYAVGEALKKKYPKGDVLVSSRKSSLLYLHSGTYCTGFSSSLNDTTVIQGLMRGNTDFVIIDQLGYSSTYRYLLPAVQKNQELFKTVLHLKEPDTYLLWFDKDKARKKYE